MRTITVIAPVCKIIVLVRVTVIASVTFFAHEGVIYEANGLFSLFGQLGLLSPAIS